MTLFAKLSNIVPNILKEHLLRIQNSMWFLSMVLKNSQVSISGICGSCTSPKDFYHTGHVVNFEYWVQKNFESNRHRSAYISFQIERMCFFNKKNIIKVFEKNIKSAQFIYSTHNFGSLSIHLVLKLLKNQNVYKYCNIL